MFVFLRFIFIKRIRRNFNKSSEEFVRRFRTLFAEFRLIYWHTLALDAAYAQMRSQIRTLFHSDELFQKYLLEDAMSAYTKKRESEFPDKEKFIAATLEDLLEQCICLQLLARRQYHYLFYPGAPYRAMAYLNTLLLSPLKWIHVFLTIEKKTYLPADMQ